MNRFFSSPDNDVILVIADRLLEAFKQMYPGVVEDAMAAIRNGQSVEQAGRIMMAGVQTTQDQIRQAESDKQKKLQESIDRLKDQLAKSQHDRTQIQSHNKTLQMTSDLQLEELKDLRETVTIQNRILARQQQKLQNLLGNSIDDE
jgi:septal ring factor EnvC (AmiA/AmiB activator)